MIQTQYNVKRFSGLLRVRAPTNLYTNMIPILLKITLDKTTRLVSNLGSETSYRQKSSIPHKWLIWFFYSYYYFRRSKLPSGPCRSRLGLPFHFRDVELGHSQFLYQKTNCFSTYLNSRMFSLKKNLSPAEITLICSI